MLFSVAVCTYNRADILQVCLDSLVEQEIDKSLYEVIVVNNNSTDNTQDVAERYAALFDNFLVVFENKQGLSHARNRGWMEARGQYVAYTDDDCKIPSQWLMWAKEVVTDFAPAVFGGPYFAFYNSPKPRWFKDSYGSLGLGDRGRPLTSNEYLNGANIFFHRPLLKDLNGFDVNYGMSGQTIAYGEETALLIKIRSTMPDQVIYYEPKLHMYHLVPEHKMKFNWIIRQHLASGKYEYLVLEDHSPSGKGTFLVIRQLAQMTFALMVDIVKGVMLRDRMKYPYLKNYLYEHTMSFFYRIGRLSEQLRQAMISKRHLEEKKKAH